jgi:hypothetical protein
LLPSVVVPWHGGIDYGGGGGGSVSSSIIIISQIVFVLVGEDEKGSERNE